MTADNVNGITIEYDVHADNGEDNEPLLLVMGLGGQLTAWPLEFVERRIKVVRLRAFVAVAR